jgi:molybdopterin-guanine dinucleotide biosynthesis protein A
LLHVAAKQLKVDIKNSAQESEKVIMKGLKEAGIEVESVSVEKGFININRA